MEQIDFEQHWQTNYYETLPKVKIERANLFLKPLFEFLKNKSDLSILDAGCGDGVHVEVISNSPFNDLLINKVAIDISKTALARTKRMQHKEWQYTQGDIGFLPFHNCAFDVVFSFGVIGYTDCPEKAFAELCRATKNDGLLGIWLFPKTKGIGGWIFSLVRMLCKFVGLLGTKLIANLIIPFLGILPTNSRINLSNASWKQCREVVLVNIAPKQLYFPEKEEIVQWFNKEKIEIILNDQKNPITIWGRKWRI